MSAAKPAVSPFNISAGMQAALDAAQQQMQSKTAAASGATAHPGMEISGVAGAVGKQEVEAQDTIETTAVPIQSPTLVTFYSRIDGARYVFKDGSVALFRGGVFHFDPQNPQEPYTTEQWAEMHKDLLYVTKVPNSIFSRTLVPLVKSDAIPLREVGNAGGGADPRSGAGLIGSTLLNGNIAGVFASEA